MPRVQRLTENREKFLPSLRLLFFNLNLLYVFILSACGRSVVAASQGYSLLVTLGFLSAVASLVAEHGL